MIDITKHKTWQYVYLLILLYNTKCLFQVTETEVNLMFSKRNACDDSWLCVVPYDNDVHKYISCMVYMEFMIGNQ